MVTGHLPLRRGGLGGRKEGERLENNIIWQPQPKQTEFLSRWEDEVLYGGAAGGGKSDALIVEALRQVHIPHYRGLILRKTFPECRTLIDKSLTYYSRAVPGAKYNDSKHSWTFPSGSVIYFGSLQYSKDKHKYQGQNYDFIGIDELTHFAYDEYVYLKSRNRPQGPGTRCYMRMTCNPGGVGHGWVKERFIAGKVPYQTYYEDVSVEGKEYKRARAFIPATVFDNQALLANDPMYVANLGSLPEAEKRALLYGDWDSFSGQVFTEFKDDPAHYLDRRHTHVIEPFPIPKHWRRYRSFDFGYTRPFSVGWWAVDEDGRLYRYRELYGCTGEPNHGVRWEPHEIARKIRELEEKYDAGCKIYGIADPSIWDTSRGTAGSVRAQMEKERIYFEKGKNDRLSGKMQCHYRFSFDDEGIPGAYIFNTCKDFIRTVPNLVYDEMDVEDINTDGEDHIYDEMRYMFMSMPVKSKPVTKEKQREWNPLL